MSSDCVSSVTLFDQELISYRHSSCSTSWWHSRVTWVTWRQFACKWSDASWVTWSSYSTAATHRCSAPRGQPTNQYDRLLAKYWLSVCLSVTVALRVGVGGWKLYHHVPTRALPIHFFRYFCCRMYCLASDSTKIVNHCARRIVTLFYAPYKCSYLLTIEVLLLYCIVQ